MNKNKKKMVHSWCMYDWANSAFATTIMAAVFPVFYSKFAGNNFEPSVITSYWGYTNTIAMAITACVAPLLGAIADFKEQKKLFLIWFTLLGVVATAFMGLIPAGGWALASLLFIIGRVGFSGANIFYDSLLPHITDRIDSTSTRGYAYGYLGGGILLALNSAVIIKPQFFGLTGAESGMRLSFVSVSVWWAIFSIPIFKNVPEPPGSTLRDAKQISWLKGGFLKLLETLKEIRSYKEALIFLIAFLLYNDGIGTIIVMATIFGSEIGISPGNLIGAILMVQFLGVPFTLLFGKCTSFISTKMAIFIALAIYIAISIFGFFVTTSTHFWILAFLVGTVQGGAQGLSRSMFGSMIPKKKSAEFFGFYDVSSKFSGLLGPFIFGITGQLTGSSRYGIIALIFFFISGALFLLKVDHKKGIKAALLEN